MSFVEIEPVLAGLGWSPFFDRQLLAFRESEAASSAVLPYRIAIDRGTEYGLLGADGPRRAVLAGRIARDLSGERRPCVGDFVLAKAVDNGELLRIEHVFERRSVFLRKAVGGTSEGQAIAANVDVAIVVCALTADEADPHAVSHGLNVRRIERYLRAIHDANVQALVLVNKADLQPSAEAQVLELSRELGNADVIAASALAGHNMDRVRGYLGPGSTAVLVGSSGVGKSSLMNALLGRAAQKVHEVREADARGRHTTTHRELFALPTGGLLIDTPGMREFALFGDEEPARGTGFEDIDELAEACRFTDCTHESEPGCAVRAAVERGAIPAARLEHARKLVKERAFQQSRHDASKRRTDKQRGRELSRAVRSQQRLKNRDD